MLQSFYTGNSGLNANKTWLGVISDNIANVNTNGFKQERVNFSDLVASSLTTYSSSGAPRNKEIGGGAFVAGTIKDFSQGSFKNTNQPLSLALDGEGFFMVKNPSADLTYYTRAGDFRVDANGDVISPAGLKLQGWMLDETGNIAGAMGSINIPNNLDPKNTDKVAFENPANLDAGVDAITKTFDPSDATTYHYVNTITTYDSLGTAHVLKHYFVKTDTNTWRVYTQLDDRAITYTDGANEYASLELKFNGKGELTSAYYMRIPTLNQNDTASEISDDGVFTLNTVPVLPGTVFITKDQNNQDVTWNDDGSGNIVDIKTGEIKGSISYDDGKITIIGAAGDGNTNSITVTYKDYKYTSALEASDDGTNSVYNTGITNIAPGTLAIYVWDDGTDGTNDISNGPWTDKNGDGNIYDSTNTQVGTIDYQTGTITLTNGDGDTNDTIEFEYGIKVTDLGNISTTTINYSNNESRFLNNGATDSSISEDFKKLTQLDSEFIFYAQQNGASKGDLMSISVTEDGIIKGTYTNGQVKDVARLAVATFKDKEILVRKGDNLYLPNQQTFTPIIVPGGVISKIRSGMLEMSNVDISQEFINLITAQRAYQANAKTITTSDQILQTTMDIKR
ncbi:MULTISPECIES: flagellar hook protein FlgE [unclassified Nitratiruptor]|uniref:flagellar hook protein FlgE n=1 Tax=unclassified Nitratiruptor TaxID=2624044 RepID=UPI00191658ED|nr:MULTISPECIES: flagellar hook-basal body complex protein [unclassified Nitratiruptor]BCD59928.1 flagellar hook protein FlgE [Nitratiruptor sp. YY08-10]BCD63851.1 flagellar hook protein FlgE [Nitratiruptor sp. YY08-14]